jgi:polynucleotide 5'-hydroxyl-kinase GRC3/NOL9
MSAILSFQEALTLLTTLPERGAAMVIGDTDTGKSTFLAEAREKLTEKLTEKLVALVDTDTGQSEVGPPGTVGVTLGDRSALFFNGSFTPTGAGLEHLTASHQAMVWARQREAETILIDTPGFVYGNTARRFILSLVQLTLPSVILAFQHEAEIEPLLSFLEIATDVPVVRVQSVAGAVRKSPAVRATRRNGKLTRVFEKEYTVAIPLDTLEILGMSLGSGQILPPHQLEWCANTLRLPILRGEHVENSLVLYTEKSVPSQREQFLIPIQEHFRTTNVRLLSIQYHMGLYGALYGEKGRLLALAQSASLDHTRNEMSFYTTSKITAERVKLLRIGRVRLKADHTFHSEVKTGEV